MTTKKKSKFALPKKRTTMQDITESTTFKADSPVQKDELSSLEHGKKAPDTSSDSKRISRTDVLKTAVAGVAGMAVSVIAGSHDASAAPLTTTDTNFVATGSATTAIGFDASSQAAQFIYGVEANGTVSGVYGTSTNGYGLRGESNNNDGVIGVTSSNNAIAGVRGIARASGYGGWFEAGGSAGAPLHLAPSNIVGHPTFGNFLQGDIFVDTNGTIWVCITTGNPGKWKRILTHS